MYAKRFSKRRPPLEPNSSGTSQSNDMFISFQSTATAQPITTSDFKDLKAAFTLLDTNCDGKVNASELKNMMETLGISVTDEQVQHLISQASATGDGLISEDEFLQFMSRQSPDSDDIVSDLVAAFRVFDKDNNGYISRDELKRAMEMIGENVSESCLDELLRAADVDKDGRINYEEFARMLL